MNDDFVSSLEKKVIEKGGYEGKSLLICAPTNTGKSYIAQKLLIHYLEGQDIGYTSVYLCPYKALAEEISNSLDEMIQARVRDAEARGDSSLLEYRRPVLSTGDYSEPVDFSLVPLLVATYEKFAALISRRQDFRPYVVIADEIQLMSDESRGARAEFLVSSVVRGHRIERQVLFYGLSAVIGNAKKLAKWLDVSLVQGDESDRFVKLDIRPACVHDNDAATDFIRKTVTEEVKKKNQVLILDPSARHSSEKRAGGLQEVVNKLLQGTERSMCESIASQLERIAPYLRTLANMVRNGVAYHHAGLDLQARRLLEKSFRREGLPKVICCSPTLAAGVNLPAARVILRNPVFQGDGRRPLTASECLNMLGRAGRFIRERSEQTPGVANICLTANQAEECTETLKAVGQKMPGDVQSQISNSLSHVMDFILWSIQMQGAMTLDQILEAYEGTLWAFERQRREKILQTGKSSQIAVAALNHDHKLDDLRVHRAPTLEGKTIQGAIRSPNGVYEIGISNWGRPKCDGPQQHPSQSCKHVRKLLSASITSRKNGTLPIAAFDSAMRLIPEFRNNMPPERTLKFAVEILVDWQFLTQTGTTYEITEDGKIAAASWLPKSLVHSLRERVSQTDKVSFSDATAWAREDVVGIGINASDLRALPQCLDLWLEGAPPDQIVGCMTGERGYQDFLGARDNMVTILRTYISFAKIQDKNALIKPLLKAARRIQYGVPEQGLPLACMALKALSRERLVDLIRKRVWNLHDLAKMDKGKVTLFGESADRIGDAIDEARFRLSKIERLQKMKPGPDQRRGIFELTTEFGMGLDDFMEFVLGEPGK